MSTYDLNYLTQWVHKTYRIPNHAPTIQPDPPDWMGSALCAQVDPELFFPEKGGGTRAAKRVCGGCPVRQECLAAALASHEPDGVWGGLSPRQRRKLTHAHGEHVCDQCGARFVKQTQLAGHLGHHSRTAA